MVENFVRNGENADYQHILHFSQCFQKLCASLSTFKVDIVW